MERFVVATAAGGWRSRPAPTRSGGFWREAELLAAGRHPGVVDLVTTEEGERPALVTARVEGPTLGESPPRLVEEMAGVTAGVAATLADLHGLGIVHGALCPSHVLLAGGRPVLCGFSYGAYAGQRRCHPFAAPDGFADAAFAPDDPVLAATDVYGVGALMRWLLHEGCRASGRPSRPHLALRALAARATAADPTRRPTAAELAAAIRAAVPSGRLPAGRLPAGAARSPRPVASERRRRAATIAAAAALSAAGLLAGVGLAGVGLVGKPRAPRGAMAPTQPSAAPAAQARCPSGPPAAASAADIDGDGCAEELRYADGVLEAGSAQWTVGQAGDVVVAADWTCSGVSTLALLRPTSGEVYVFAGWAQPGRDLAGELVGRIDTGIGLRPDDLDGDACPELVVDRGNGPPLPVPVTGGP